ncbi:two component, sigma54 specific, transcriptional regulator, Fis family [Paucidesulfovibrio gracilis DSM 16080]|uniref:Two component, sigma54 specific, transcriptional regulator, Fis family n=1 Tax=Paucidesulfovibrio gracilis DSM 16080 TaxID=1121449 RepID=A0A1T4XLT6_9BACT|nr:sigma-54 dependent transcriptional regulator [Paucidesulfovibrio gracilis]SKA90522.1 two component, sigma54 specific, transcriptional regulator, Fis family [Paucidesulfovibrio gracilis DSM 16080]
MSKSWPHHPVLMVDDDPAWLQALQRILTLAGVTRLLPCADGREAEALLKKHQVSVVLLDLCMPHISGEELLGRLVEQYPDLPVIVLSGRDELDTAVRCIKAGAYEYFLKTTEKERLITSVRRAVELSQVREEMAKLKSAFLARGPEHPEAFSAMVTRDPKMRSLFGYAEAVAGTGLPLLITGETGTGKELMARAVHTLSGRSGPFVAVNAAGLDDSVFSDTLYGHVKGAFTGAEQHREGLVAQAAEGTLFLDEIGDLDPPSQIKLLRLLQEEEYLPLGSDRPAKSSARVVAATMEDPEHLVDQGRMRRDLYYRLAGHRIHLPPLRERIGDIPLLLDCFLDRAAGELQRTRPPVPPGLVARLEGHDFPGNVRELRSMVWDAVAGYTTGWLSVRPFQQQMRGPGKKDVAASSSENSVESYAELLELLDRLPEWREAAGLLAAEAVRRTGGNRSAAAELLGISRQALARRLPESV